MALDADADDDSDAHPAADLAADVDVGVNASTATTTTTSFMRDLLELCAIVSGFDLAATAEAAPAAATTGLL